MSVFVVLRYGEKIEGMWMGGLRDYFGGASVAWCIVDADADASLSSTSIGTFVGSSVSGVLSVNASSYRAAVMYGAVYMRFSGISGCDIPRIGPRAARDCIYALAYLYKHSRFWALGCTRRSILTMSLEFHLVRMCHGWALSSGYTNVMPKVPVPVLLLCVLNLWRCSHAFRGWALALDCRACMSSSSRIRSQICGVIWQFRRSVPRTIMNVASWCRSQFVAIRIWHVTTNPITAACMVEAVIWRGIAACNLVKTSEINPCFVARCGHSWL